MTIVNWRGSKEKDKRKVSTLELDCNKVPKLPTGGKFKPSQSTWLLSSPFLVSNNR